MGAFRAGYHARLVCSLIGEAAAIGVGDGMTRARVDSPGDQSLVVASANPRGAAIVGAPLAK